MTASFASKVRWATLIPMVRNDAATDNATNIAMPQRFFVSLLNCLLFFILFPFSYEGKKKSLGHFPRTEFAFFSRRDVKTHIRGIKNTTKLLLSSGLYRRSRNLTPSGANALCPSQTQLNTMYRLTAGMELHQSPKNRFYYLII